MHEIDSRFVNPEVTISHTKAEHNVKRSDRRRKMALEKHFAFLSKRKASSIL